MGRTLASEWQPSGGDHVPNSWGGDATDNTNYDHDYLGMPDLTSLCTVCRQIRPNEPRLSHVEAREIQIVRYSCVRTLDLYSDVRVKLRIANNCQESTHAGVRCDVLALRDLGAPACEDAP